MDVEKEEENLKDDNNNINNENRAHRSQAVHGNKKK